MIEITRLDFVPVARISAVPTDISDDELIRTLERLRQSVEQDIADGRPMLSVVDLSHARALDARQRGIMSEWIRQTRDAVTRGSMGVFFIAPSPLLRGVLTAIFWFQKLGAPHAVGANASEAAGWTVARLQETGWDVDRDLAARIEHALGAEL